jgi:hypothetical protein
VNRLGFSRSDDTISHPNASADIELEVLEKQQAAPHAGDALFEIGIIITLHLAFAWAVLVTLDAFGIR